MEGLDFRGGSSDFSGYIGTMFAELRSPDYHSIRHLFKDQKRYTPVYAVIDGVFPGRVFVDSAADSRVAIVWAIGRWAFVEGEIEKPGFDQSLTDLLDRIFLPDSRKIERKWFELYAVNSPTFMNQLERSLTGYTYSRHFESTYVWDEAAYRRFRSGYSHPAGLTIEKADLPLLPARVYDVLPGAGEFKSRTAIGFRLKIENRLVAQCRSNGFVSGQEFMIDVETFDERDRGRGYATAAGVALLDHCLERELKPLWETTEQNLASQRLAEKLGFGRSETYPVYALTF